MEDLRNFIQLFQDCKSEAEEQETAKREIATLKKKLSGRLVLSEGTHYGSMRKESIGKLIVLYMLGYDFDVQLLEILILLLSSKKFSEKRMGYMAVEFLMKEGDPNFAEVGELILQDMRDNSEQAVHFQPLAFNILANKGVEEMTKALPEEIQNFIFSSTSPVQLKRAVLSLLRLYRMNSGIKLVTNFPEKAVSLLDRMFKAKELSVVYCVLCLIEKMARNSFGVVNKTVEILHTVVTNPSYGKNHLYCTLANPWVITKAFQVLQLFPYPSKNSVWDKNSLTLIHQVIDSILAKELRFTKQEEVSGYERASLMTLLETVKSMQQLNCTKLQYQAAANQVYKVMSGNVLLHVQYTSLCCLTYIAQYDASLVSQHAKLACAFLDPHKDPTIQKAAFQFLSAVCDKAIIDSLMQTFSDYLKQRRTRLQSIADGIRGLLEKFDKMDPSLSESSDEVVGSKKEEDNALALNGVSPTVEDDDSSEDEQTPTVPPLDDVLPVELMMEVFYYLSSKDICNVRRVNSNWKRLADDEKVWRALFIRTFGLKEEPPQHLNWKRLFKRTVQWCWNDDYSARAAEVELTEDRLTATDACLKMRNTPSWTTCLGTPPIAAGRHYFEIKIDRTDDQNTIKIVFGCIDKPSKLRSNVPFGYSTRDKTSWCYRGDGVIMFRGLPDVLKGQPFSAGDRVGFKINSYKKTITFYKNGIPQGRPASGVTGELFPAVSMINGNSISINHSIFIPPLNGHSKKRHKDSSFNKER